MTGHKSFGSDNHAGAHPEVLAAIAAANTGDAEPYGADDWTSRAANELAAAFGAVGAYFVFNGTAANVLSISLLLRPFDAVICAESSHLQVDECGATERILGNKVVPVPTPDGKLTPELVQPRLTGRGDEHRAQPRVIEIAQVTELGTCYTLDELRELGEFCRAEGLYLYMDGARLANAAAYLNCDLAELAAHVDVLSFGGTKNGAVAGEAVIVMRDELIAHVPYMRKQQMQLGSKMRFIAAQFTALLEDKLWLRSAQHANAMADRLSEGLSKVADVAVRYPVQSNAVFATISRDRINVLQREWNFHTWDERENVVRWMTAFDTTEADVDAFLTAIRASDGA
ncbi:MAG TPA: low specificity L-threonine aldolase [Streptosporangiaceae bacterium]|jgi:threonine aldolase|nr:low specificity L-threonine aldolase [Streptosporangiaceae bacterium]